MVAAGTDTALRLPTAVLRPVKGFRIASLRHKGPSMPDKIRASPEDAQGLSFAIVASSSAPLLLLNDELCILAASASFCDDFAIDHDDAIGEPLSRIGAGEWAVPQLGALLHATASGAASIDGYHMDLKRNGHDVRSLVIQARKLIYRGGGDVRLIVTIVDVTDAENAERLKDALIAEKGVLLQEIQHRVANSLQIIASVLMQSARRVNSEESRLHLSDAHNRVMSIAALQRQLAVASSENVSLRPYLTDLCRSIGASMIRDPESITLTVRCDDVTSSSNMSVSLGLIVTELVINALKHAFPDDRKGKISVDYSPKGAGWTLTVTDDGIGMPSDSAAPKAGLGTTIVQALAKQLGATIEVSDTSPGTAVKVIHLGSDTPARTKAV